MFAPSSDSINQMKFLRLHDPLLSVLFEDDDIIAIDKPYGFNAHTNDSKIEHSEFIQDGLIEIYEKNRNAKLHIIHRLDQTTTGVMIFGKSTASAKKYAEFFFQKQVKKRYLFITGSSSTQKTFQVDKIIIHKAKELEAQTCFNFLRKSEKYELWEALPLTGRNHQIRIHAQSIDLPLLGDTTYSGLSYPFLCLHNQRIEFPNGLVIESAPPVYFNDLNLLGDAALARVFFEADRRQRLFQDKHNNLSYRNAHVFNSTSQSIDYTLDRFGQNQLLTWSKEKWDQYDLKRFEAFATATNTTIDVKLTSQKKSEFKINSTENKELVIEESGLKYKVKKDSSPTMALSMDQRLHRQWIYTNATDKSVLCLFAAQGSAIVAATAGKAREITAIEMNKNGLNWGRDNLALNGFNTDHIKFLNRDSSIFLEQCAQKKLMYDLIINPIPSFYRKEKGLFKIENELETLIKNSLLCLNKKGQLLLSTTSDSFYINQIDELILKVQKELKMSDLEINCILPSLDFELPHEKSILKSFVIHNP
jgi:23S rRNA (cytosine1962-C5)-methyltransferase